MFTDFASLEEWLEHIERVHPRTIELGLERVTSVAKTLALRPRFSIITVAGTNGKGSACAMLEAILHHARYKVGCYTSPHLRAFNERIRIGKTDASDATLIRALSAVERARGNTALTYFEFSTLAAVWLFAEEKVDIAVLEVGLGGRLDAVNAFDTDCALLMSVALDHMDYLGPSRDAIGFEKAGIFRRGRPAICGDDDPPQSVLSHAAAIGAELLVAGRDFGYEAQPQQWRYWGPGGERPGLPHPVLRGEYQLANAAAVLAALGKLRDAAPVSADDVRVGLLTAENPGRFQVLPGRPTVILDVAHNPAAAKALAQNLDGMRIAGRTYAVFSMLNDKDIDGVIQELKLRVDAWLISGTDGPRGTDAAAVRAALERAGVRDNVTIHGSIGEAYVQARVRATENDRIVVFGSFHTVAAVMVAQERARRAD